MAYSRLLLLLMGVISTQMPNVQARAIDFWCKNDKRKNMMEMIEDKIDCNASDTFSSPVQLPCVGIQATDWANKTLCQKRLEVLGDLEKFKGGVQDMKTQATSQCHTSVLKRLERNIINHWTIVSSLQIQNDNFTTSPPEVQNCSNQTSLNQMLREYRRFLRGKLDRLAVDVQHVIC